VATFRKRNDRWQAIVRHKNIGTKAKSFISKDEARKWAYETEKSIEANTFNKINPSTITLGGLLERYLREITPKKRGKDAEERRITRLLKDPISLNSLDKLSSACMAQFRDARLLSGPRAAQYDLVIIRHCIKTAIYEWNLDLDRNPVDYVKLPPSPRPRNRRLLDGELERIKDASQSTQNIHVLPMILFALETGMRRGEILGLEWQHVYLDKKTVFLPFTKNGLSREVPLNRSAISILEAQQNQNTSKPFPLSANAFRMAWNRLLKRADITGLRFHDLRHEAISRFFEMGLSLPEVALISGHKDPRMLFRYTHIKPESVALRLQKIKI